VAGSVSEGQRPLGTAAPSLPDGVDQKLLCFGWNQDAEAVQKAIERAALLAHYNAKDVVTEHEVAVDAHASQYNEALNLLKDRYVRKYFITYGNVSVRIRNQHGGFLSATLINPVRLVNDLHQSHYLVKNLTPLRAYMQPMQR
jgi:hypothetical protein